MQRLECNSTDIRKNGKQTGKQNYLCKTGRWQFVETDDPPFGYTDEFKRECLKMYVNGIGFRGIERVKGVHPTTVIPWVKPIGEWLPDTDDPDVPPDVGELDALETFVGSKKTKFGCG